MKISGIYSIDNITDGKSYIGSSVDIKHRWYRHLKKLRKNCHNNHHLQNAWNKYGEVNFTFRVLEESIPKNKLKNIEQQYLNIIRIFPWFYYNINYDANRVNFTEDVLLKMSLAAKKLTGKKNPFYGKHHSKETKQKIRLKLSQQIFTDVTRKKYLFQVKMHGKKQKTEKEK